METKKRGKLIYQPAGKAGEYAQWACNIYNGCSNKCEYCYNRHSLGKAILGKDEPTIKGGMDIEEAYNLFCVELEQYGYDIMRDGSLFFSFVSDPCLPETILLNSMCISRCISNYIPVTILTKNADFIHNNNWKLLLQYISIVGKSNFIQFGFTLTGCDELEPGAPSNDQRIDTMRLLWDTGFSTWASIEPIIDLEKSFSMFEKSIPVCAEYRFGLNSLKKNYTKQEVIDFKNRVEEANKQYNRKLIWKESVLKFINKK